MIDNFDQLVQRCSARRRRRMIRLSLSIVATLLLLIAAAAGYTMWLDAQPRPAAVHPSPAAVQPAKPAESNGSAPSFPAEEVKVPVAPALLSSAKTAVAKKSPPPANIPDTPAARPEPAHAADPVPSGNGELFEVSSSAKNTAEDPLEAYRNRPGYDSAIAAARDMYAKGQFAEAAVWAKKANRFNREAEEAWLLSAKSYYAQGRKKEAMGVLELYLNYKDSRAATELLRTWKNSGE